jgi:hypothetical protein
MKHLVLTSECSGIMYFYVHLKIPGHFPVGTYTCMLEFDLSWGHTHQQNLLPNTVVLFILQ